MSSAAMTPEPELRRVLSTPALIVDLDLFEANVAAMEALLRGTGKTVRPHVKTHRTPELARRQLGGSVVGHHLRNRRRGGGHGRGRLR